MTHYAKEAGRRLLALLTALLIVAGTVVPYTVRFSTADAATTYSYTMKNMYPGGTGGTNAQGDNYKLFTITGTPYGTMTGSCIQPEKDPTSSGKATITRVSNDSMLAKAAYKFGYQENWPAKSSKAFYLKRLFQYINNRSYTLSHVSQDTINKCKSNYAKLSGVTVPDNFIVYRCDPTNGSQDFIVWKLIPNGKLTLVKSSTDAKAMKTGAYNFSGITYEIYKSDKKTKVDTLTCNAAGTTKTISVSPGTYYAKETKTNAMFRLDASWKGGYKVESNKTTTIKVSDAPVLSTAKVNKSVEGGVLEEGKVLKFRLTNTKDNSIKYDLTLTGNGTATASGQLSVLAGTYTISEIDSAGMVNTTGTVTKSVAAGQTMTVDWVNTIPDHDSVNIIKTTDDGGTAAGFIFRVTGVLDNAQSISADEILSAASPVVTFPEYEGTIELGEWVVDADDLAALNQAAADRATGSYTVKLTNSVKLIPPPEPPEPEEPIIIMKSAAESVDGSTDSTVESTDDAANAAENVDEPTNPSVNAAKDVDEPTDPAEDETDPADEPTELVYTDSITVTVELKDAAYDDERQDYYSKVDDPTENTKSVEGFSVRFNDFTWYGAATVYRDSDTGEPYTLLTTKEDGKAYRAGHDEPGIDPAYKGEYTAEEVLTDDQKALYKTPAPQTETLRKGETVTFCFENKAKRTPVRLVKTSNDGNVSGINFRLTGRTELGDTVRIDASTDADGCIDFGAVHAGTYVIEETGFDEKRYVNTEPLDGYSRPAKEITVTGEEIEDIVVTFRNQTITRLRLTKVDGETYDFLENAVFRLLEEGEPAAVFQIVMNDDNTGGVNMIWSNGKIRGEMSKTILPTDEDDVAEADIIDAPDDDESTDPAAQSTDSAEHAAENVDEQSDFAAEPDGEPVTDPSDSDYFWAYLENLTIGKEYTLEEITPPAGYTKMQPVTFTFRDDEEEPLTFRLLNYQPRIRTTAADSETHTHMSAADGSVTIIDTVRYEHLEPNKEYVMKGQLMIPVEGVEGETEASEMPLLVNGKTVTSEVRFSSGETGSGEIEMPFLFNGSALAGQTVVVYENCVDPATGKIIATHSVIDDADQTISFPVIGTTAKDPDSQTGFGVPKENETVTDTVRYEKLEPGLTYVMRGTLVDKETREPLKDMDGNDCTAEQVFTADETGSGEVTMTFAVDASQMLGRKAVAFEACYLAGDREILVAIHKNPYDKEQTIEYPAPSYEMYKVRNEAATEQGSTGRYGFLDGDTVTYDVVIQNTGNVPLTMTVSDTFLEHPEYFTTPEVLRVQNVGQYLLSEDGNTVNITVEKGETAIVVYRTTVKPETAEYLAAAPKDSDSLDADGHDVNKSVRVNEPDEKDGYRNMARTTDVTFPNPEKPEEPLPFPDSNKEDDAQTPVRKPSIGTRFTDSLRRKTIKPAENTVLVDTVSYTGLTPGKEYVFEGILMVKDTGRSLLLDGKPVTATTGPVIPSKEDGQVKVAFTIDTTGLGGKELVAFETVYRTGKPSDDADSDDDTEKTIVAEHQDLNDKGQTVIVSSGIVHTGDGSKLILLIVVFATADGLLFAFTHYRTQLQKEIDEAMK